MVANYYWHGVASAESVHFQGDSTEFAYLTTKLHNLCDWFIKEDSFPEKIVYDLRVHIWDLKSDTQLLSLTENFLICLVISSHVRKLCTK